MSGGNDANLHNGLQNSVSIPLPASAIHQANSNANMKFDKG